MFPRMHLVCLSEFCYTQQWRFSAKFFRKDYLIIIIIIIVITIIIIISSEGFQPNSPERLFSVKYLVNFLLLGDGYKFLDDHSCAILEAYLLDSLRFSEVPFLTFHPPGKAFFFIGKRKPKIFGFKNVMEEERKILTFVICYPGFCT